MIIMANLKTIKYYLDKWEASVLIYRQNNDENVIRFRFINSVARDINTLKRKIISHERCPTYNTRVALNEINVLYADLLIKVAPCCLFA